MTISTYIVIFGKFDSIEVRATSCKQAVSVAKALDPELANKCRSRRSAVKAVKV